jgi:UrcA family protein
MKTSFFAAALTVAAFAASAPVLASEGGDRLPSMDVTYSDLNLGNRAGAETLLRRIRSAASVVCGVNENKKSFRDLRATREVRTCVRIAVEGAVRQVNAPLVTALYYGVEQVDPRFAEGTAR